MFQWFTQKNVHIQVLEKDVVIHATVVYICANMPRGARHYVTIRFYTFIKMNLYGSYAIHVFPKPTVNIKFTYWYNKRLLKIAICKIHETTFSSAYAEYLQIFMNLNPKECTCILYVIVQRMTVPLGLRANIARPRVGILPTGTDASSAVLAREVIVTSPLGVTLN